MDKKWTRKFFVLLAAALSAGFAAAHGGAPDTDSTGVVQNRIAPENGDMPLYLTIDLDVIDLNEKLLKWLSDNNIPVTIFVSTRWLFPEKYNSHADRHVQFHKISKNPLFKIENGGYPGNHVSNIPTANTILGNSIGGEIIPMRRDSIDRVRTPVWYRSASVKHTPDELRYISDSLGMSVAGAAIQFNRANRDAILDARPGDIWCIDIRISDVPTQTAFINMIAELRMRGFVFRNLPRAR